MKRNVSVSELEEGNEVLLDSVTGRSQIVEMAETVNGETTVTLIDGRSSRHPSVQVVTVLS